MAYIFIYIFNIILIHVASTCIKRHKELSILIFIFIILNLSIFIGYRDYQVGFDTLAYPYDTYIEIKNAHNISAVLKDINIEKGYAILCLISIHIYKSFNFFLFITHVIIITCFLYSFILLRRKLNITLSMFMFCFLCLNQSISMSRQYLALGFCLLSIAFFIRGYKIRSIVLMAISPFLHLSSLVFIPAYIFFSKSYRLHMTKIIILYLTLYAFLFINYQLFFSSIISDYNFNEKYLSYTNDQWGGFFSFSEFIVRTVFIIIFYIYSKKSKNIDVELRKSLLSILIVDYTINLLQIQSRFLGRMSLYYYIVYLIALPFIFKKNKTTKTKFILPKYIIISLCIAYWFYVYIISGADGTYPYSSKLLGL